ncbi:MAG: peptide chain release factor N(5)-glutamine methyltransferase [Sphingomonas fennica]
MSGATVTAALAGATRALAAVSDTARLDAELLMAAALGCTRETMLLARGGAAVPPGFAALIDRRLAHEPIAYILGERDFWTITLAVTPAVLIPRADSETLIEAAIDRFGARAPATVLDLGTGSGALLLAALAQWPQATGTGVDASAAALAVAADNAARLGLAPRARFLHGDWDAACPARFDLLLCNPPYVETDAALPPDVARYEPAAALFAGVDGLDDYRRLAPLLPRMLAPGGVGCVEIGREQAAAVSALFAAAGLGVSVRRDLAGHDRCLIVTG